MDIKAVNKPQEVWEDDSKVLKELSLKQAEMLVMVRDFQLQLMLAALQWEIILVLHWGKWVKNINKEHIISIHGQNLAVGRS